MGPCVSLRTALCPKIWCCRGPNLDQALLKRTRHEVSFFFLKFRTVEAYCWGWKALGAIARSNDQQQFTTQLFKQDYYISTKSGNRFLFQHTLILTHTFLENQDSKSRFTYILYSTPSKHETQFLVFLGITLIQQTQPNKRNSEQIIKSPNVA